MDASSIGSALVTANEKRLIDNVADQDSWRLPEKALRGYPAGDRSLVRRLRLGASLLRNSI